MIGTGAEGSAGQGHSVSLSADATTALLGGEDDGYSGAIWIFTQSSTGIRGPAGGPVTHFTLDQNYPNPFNPTTTIQFALPSRSDVILRVYNTLGQPVATLVTGEQDAGNHEVRFDGSGLASGVYFYRISAGSFLETKRLLLVR